VPPKAGLTYAKGTVHTQRGAVHVEWRRTPRGVVLHVDLPDNVRARVLLPGEAGHSYFGAGQGAPTFVGVEDGRAVFEVGSGRSVFAPGRG
jgi:alpha-L-rhamnosidase